MTSLTWDEYFAQMSNYLLAIRRAAQLGSNFPSAPPERPTDPIPDDYRDQAGRLSDACDELATEVTTRMAVIAGRPPSARQSPHQEYRVANYLETDM